MDIIKKCNLCKQIRPHRNRPQRPIGQAFYCCRSCEAKKQRINERIRKLVYVKMLGEKCSICGLIDHPCIYDFHHVAPLEKTNVISRVPKHLQIKELKKCNLLCGSCHRKQEHSTKFVAETDIWKKCKKCLQYAPHYIKHSKSRPTNKESREKRNKEIQNDMIKRWKLGEKINKAKQSRHWSNGEWNQFCMDKFKIGQRSASDYERLFLNYSLNNLPTSINAMKHKNGRRLLDKNKKYYSSCCRNCHNELGKKRQYKYKSEAIKYLGGKCSVCGIVDEPCVYDFHHKDPNQKDYKISSKTLGFEKMKQELDKCILLCCLCHRKLHAGILHI